MALKFASVCDLMRMVIAVRLSALRLVTIVIFPDTKISLVPDYGLSPIKKPYQWLHANVETALNIK